MIQIVIKIIVCTISTMLLSAEGDNRVRNPFCFASTDVHKVIVMPHAKKTIKQNPKKSAEILYNNQRKMVSVGDTLGEWEIVDISDDTVVLKNKNGQMHALSY